MLIFKNTLQYLYQESSSHSEEHFVKCKNWLFCHFVSTVPSRMTQRTGKAPIYLLFIIELLFGSQELLSFLRS